TGMVVQTGKEVVVPDIKKDPRFLGKTKSRTHAKGQRVSFFCVPIKLESRTVGALSVDRKASQGDDFEANVRLLGIIATMIAQAVKLNNLVESDRMRLRDENARLRRELKTKFNIHNMVGNSNAMHEVYRLIEQVANSNATVLIRGESGTGKDLVAHAVHYNSLRSEKPFVKVNCTALPETLLESELFGYEKGAFTGANKKGKMGLFELAHMGTIFLDEIADMSLEAQSKVLRVLEELQFERVGGVSPIKIDVRVIAATNKDIQEEISKGRFREDLYYRVNVVCLKMPPLRQRREDIPALCRHLCRRIADLFEMPPRSVSPQAMAALCRYGWPGNVRELANVIQHGYALG
ncbi:hypothetical protein LCGC14_3082700, partial [marine sediment metagenome]